MPVPIAEVLRDQMSTPTAADRLGLADVGNSVFPNPPAGDIGLSAAPTFGSRLGGWLQERVTGGPASADEPLLGMMPTPGATPAKWFASGAPPMRLKRALDILGVPIEPAVPRSARFSGGGPVGVRPLPERIPGGPDYVYETAKQAYIQRAKSQHPDVGGTEEGMKLLNQAMSFVERHFGPKPKQSLFGLAAGLGLADVGQEQATAP